MESKKKAGRPDLYGEKTVIFQRKVPQSKHAYITELIDTILAKYKKQKS